jgi:hypothetical protein
MFITYLYTTLYLSNAYVSLVLVTKSEAKYRIRAALCYGFTVTIHGSYYKLHIFEDLLT